jgi:hypothetical protein
MLKILSFSPDREAGNGSFAPPWGTVFAERGRQLRSIVGETVQTNGGCVFSALEGRSGRMYG